LKEISAMKSKIVVLEVLSVLVVLPLSDALAQQAPDSASIQVITTFDYPGSGNSTFPTAINDHGDIAGIYVDMGGITRGFVRFRNGKFSAPIVEPNDTGGATSAKGINHARVISGFYTGSDGFSHGYFLSHGTSRSSM
jgi:hypothetical protein